MTLPEVMLKINLITGAVSAAELQQGGAPLGLSLHGHVGPVLDNVVLTPEPA